MWDLLFENVASEEFHYITHAGEVNFQIASVGYNCVLGRPGLQISFLWWTCFHYFGQCWRHCSSLSYCRSINNRCDAIAERFFSSHQLMLSAVFVRLHPAKRFREASSSYRHDQTKKKASINRIFSPTYASRWRHCADSPKHFFLHEWHFPKPVQRRWVLSSLFFSRACIPKHSRLHVSPISLKKSAKNHSHLDDTPKSDHLLLLTLASTNLRSYFTGSFL